MVDSEEIIVIQINWRYMLGVDQADVVRAEGCNVTFKSEELIFIQYISRYRRGAVKTDVFITEEYMVRVAV